MKYNNLTVEQKSQILIGFRSMPYSATLINEILEKKNPNISYNDEMKCHYIPYFGEFNDICNDLWETYQSI